MPRGYRRFPNPRYGGYRSDWGRARSLQRALRGGRRGCPLMLVLCFGIVLALVAAARRIQ